MILFGESQSYARIDLLEKEKGAAGAKHELALDGQCVCFCFTKIPHYIALVTQYVFLRL